MKIRSIERIVGTACKSLQNSLWWYWPASGDNEIAERNVTAHIAHVFLRSRWRVYAEASFPYEANKRVDLLAIQIGKKAIVVGESKLLHDGTKAASLALDAKRLRGFRLSDEHGWRPPVSHRYGLLLALTYNPDVANWWANDKLLTKPPKGTSGSGWKKLGRKLKNYRARRKKVLLWWYRAKKKRKRVEHWLVYAIYKVPS